MGLFGMSKKDVDKIKSVLTGLIASGSNVARSQVDRQQIDRMYTNINNADRKALLRHIDEKGEDATLSAYTTELENAFAREVVVQYMSLATGIPTHEMNKEVIEEMLNNLSDSHKKEYIRIARERGMGTLIREMAAAMKGTMRI